MTKRQHRQLDCGLLVHDDSTASPARATDTVQVVGATGTVERVHLGKVGSLLGYTIGLGFAVVKFSDRESPSLVHPDCVARVGTLVQS
jgi:hypothetical protein